MTIRSGSPWGRFWAVGAIILAVTFAVSGCSVVSAANTTTLNVLTGSGQAPRAGECWTESYDQLNSWETWKGAAPVDCADDHEAYTYAVRKLPGEFTGSWEDSHGDVRSDVDESAYDLCQSEQKKFLPHLSDVEFLLYPTYLLPSVANWNAGARWVRCDIGEVQVGSLLSSPRLAFLPYRIGELVKRLAAQPAQFDYCIDDHGDSPSDPEGQHALYAQCMNGPDWTLRATLTVPGDDNASYPGQAGIHPLIHSECTLKYSTATRRTVAVFPSKESWEAGDRSVYCWLSAPGL